MALWWPIGKATCALVVVPLSTAHAQDGIKPLAGSTFVATGEDGLRVLSRDGKTVAALFTISLGAQQAPPYRSKAPATGPVRPAPGRG